MSEVVTVNGNWTDVDTMGEERVEDDPEILSLKGKGLNKGWGVDEGRTQNGDLEVNCKVRAKRVRLKIFEIWACSLPKVGLYFPTQFYLLYDFQINIPQHRAFILLLESSGNCGSPSLIFLNQHSRSL